jgi:hypothetical protein
MARVKKEPNSEGSHDIEVIKSDPSPKEVPQGDPSLPEEISYYPFEIDPNDCEKYGLAPEYKEAKSITVESPVNFSVRW